MTEQLAKYEETQKLLLFKTEQGSKTVFYRQHKERDPAPVKTHEVDQSKITCLFDGEKIKHVVFDNYREIPEFFSSFGYGFNSREIGRFFRNNLKGKHDTIIFTKKGKSKISGKSLLINQKDFDVLEKSINSEQYACNQTKNQLITNFLSDHFPSLAFEHRETNSNKDLVLRNLNEKLINKLTSADIETIGNFYVEASKKFKRQDVVRKVLADLQKNSRIITLQQLIKQYKELLDKNPPEKGWQSFFDEYITLFDTRYVRKLNQKNIAVGITKYPDIVLVDVYGYIDFYELKKSSAKILDYDSSHKTFYWSKEMSMAIAQVSDYLQKAKDNSKQYAETIKQETQTDDQSGIEVTIINPKAIIVAGSKAQLNTDKKRHAFKTLRESLKDIEFILYDELLERLENLLNHIKLETAKPTTKKSRKKQ